MLYNRELLLPEFQGTKCGGAISGGNISWPDSISEQSPRGGGTFGSKIN